jgi:2-polyprenyl-6-methoxyphenol hydroxylase-like FAD-dependent oxidoreductase
MATAHSFDVIVVGGGTAGSTLGGLLAKSGLGVLVVEKEARFRDRVRGESTYPWGVAEALRAGLGDLLKQAGALELSAFQNYKDRRVASTCVWATDSIDGVSEIGFSHPRMQEEDSIFLRHADLMVSWLMKRLAGCISGNPWRRPSDPRPAPVSHWPLGATPRRTLPRSSPSLSRA